MKIAPELRGLAVGEGDVDPVGNRPGLSSPQAYRWANDKDPAALTLFADLNGPDTGTMSGASIGTPGAKTQPTAETALDFLERTALDARVSSDKITKIAGTTRSGEYPQSQLGQSLSLVSRMISGGLTARVYYVSHGGFDTHTNQGGTHQRLSLNSTPTSRPSSPT